MMISSIFYPLGHASLFTAFLRISAGVRDLLAPCEYEFRRHYLAIASRLILVNQSVYLDLVIFLLNWD